MTVCGKSLSRSLLGVKRTKADIRCYLMAILYVDADVNRYDPVSLASGRTMRRREFIKGIVGSAVAARPFAARAQQAAMPVVGFLDTGTSKNDPELMPAFFRGLAENGRNARF